MNPKERKPPKAAFKIDHSGSGNPIKSLSNFTTKVEKFLIILNRDTGQIIPVEVSTPIEYVPFGFCALPFVGRSKQIDKMIRRYQRRPSLLEKYIDR